MNAQNSVQRSTRRIAYLSAKHTRNHIFRPIHSNYVYLQQAHLLSNVSNQKKHTQTQQNHPHWISFNTFTTSPTEDKKKQKRPLLNRFFRLFAIGPKINYLLEKSGAIESHSLINLISTSSALAVYAFIGVTALSHFNVDTTPFVGLFGVGGAAIGFGMKDIANNYVCGIVMALQSTFKRGDEVTVSNSFTGIVQKMNLRHLELETVQDGEKKLIYIPNSDVFSKPIVVHHKMPSDAPDAMVTEAEENAS